MINRKIKDYSKFLQVTIKWLAIQSGFSKLPIDLKDLLEKFLLILRTRGPREAIKFTKTLRASLFRILSRSSSIVLSFEGIAVPKELRFLRYTKELSVPYIKLLITILYSSRNLRTKAIVDHSSITGPSKMRIYPFTMSDFHEFWGALGYSKFSKPDKSLDFKSYHQTTKTGPNGHALMCSFTDLMTLKESYPDILEQIFILSGDKLKSYINLLIKYKNHIKDLFPLPENPIIRKLIVFPDKEGKTREIAIFDYFSQTSLIPIHYYLFRALKKIPQDYSFDQTNYKSSLSNSEIFYSIDLTAFTDRFPIIINKDLISARIGSKRAQAWHDIMTVGFTYGEDNISYSVGNPMGAYSSWNSTTLSHHFVVWKACMNTNTEWSTLPYAMLGDDLVIGHKLVALEYCRLIRTLGVEWSKEKTHVSPYFYEFAKRLQWNGDDISPFPLSGLFTERDSLYGFLNVIDNSISKGWFSLDRLKTLDSLMDWYSLRGFPRRFRTARKHLLGIAWTIMSIIQSKSSALELIPFVEKISPEVSSKLDESKILNILSSAVMMAFVQSNESLTDIRKNSKPLGRMAEQFVIHLISIFDLKENQDAISLPDSLPHTHVWGLILEDYLKVQRKAYNIDTLDHGNWHLSLRDLNIPRSDESIYLKRKMIKSNVNYSMIINNFEDSIHQLKLYPLLI